MELSIIIINWNSVEYVRKCLNTLFKNTHGIEYETIVIDNGSYDGCEKMISDEFPKVRFLQIRDNLGFARANNFGSEKAIGEYLLFLNPDTEIMDNSIPGLLSTFKSLPGAGVLGCRLLNSDLSLQMSCVQRFPTILNQILDSEIANRWFPLLSIRREIYSDNNPTKAEVVPGTCMMIRRKAFDEVEKFSPAYFMYTEDVDLCHKLLQAGYMNYYTGRYTVIHHGGGSSQQRKENAFANVQMKESIYKFLKKSRGWFYADLYKIGMLLNGIMRIFLISIAIAIRPFTFQKSNRKASLKKWKGIIFWSLGMEKWAR